MTPKFITVNIVNHGLTDGSLRTLTLALGNPQFIEGNDMTLGYPATATLTINGSIPGAPVITSAQTATGTEGVPFSYQMVASASPTKYGFQGDANGLTIDKTTGIISGTPKAGARAGCVHAQRLQRGRQRLRAVDHHLLAGRASHHQRRDGRRHGQQALFLHDHGQRRRAAELRGGQPAPWAERGHAHGGDLGDAQGAGHARPDALCLQQRGQRLGPVDADGRAGARAGHHPAPRRRRARWARASRTR